MKNKIIHSHIGDLIYDPDLGWYEGKLIHKNAELKLNLSTEDERETDQLIEVASGLSSNLSSVINKAEEYSATALINLKNSVWIEEDGTEITKQQFSNRLSIESITIYPDNSMELIFDDGDLFFGHVIIVSIDKLGNYEDATIAG